MPKLSGVFPVLPTPFTAENAVDEAAFRRLIDFAVEARVDGVVFPGMASEVETLSAAERGQMVAVLGAHLAGRLPFIVGASHADPAESAARAREGMAVGAVCAMIMAPPQAGQDVAKQVAFFRAVAEAAPGLVIMLQNAPAPNGAALSPEAVAAVAEAVPAIRYVKEETLPCGQHVSRILAAAHGRLEGVMGGAGARFVLDEFARGANGTMPALELADAHAALWTAWQSGDRAQARRIYTETLPLLLFQMNFRVRATKEVLRRRGLLEHVGARAAGPRFDAGDLAEIGELIATAAPMMTMHKPR
ncbi:dihydrodipicolinate synthase family protein [Falsiroseomonas tokyonensis]|uniref:Dihydrodipicolinate synthase family protein n=1 Tax=Falsiroseomonas tokyonensis TaxID=430521 RepID=A0ABV7BTV3_9PROT|nr:dihydrodipicolinate synthase family protein [Falsiroseomonas tokyonensis]MBU8537513.1 dihydrodipicolinate synthase family protein [Falsiroseomonas tokyonensis]